MRDAIEQFRDAMARRGIVVPAEIVADGHIHRCDAEGKNGKGDAAYLLHLNGVPAGGYENWRDGLGWENWRADLGRTLSHVEEIAHRAKIEEAKRERDAEAVKRRAEACARAVAIWEAATPAIEDHTYLTRKCIQANGARLYKGALVIPMRADGEIHSLQFISAHGDKRFLTEGRVKGCYFSIGNPKSAAALCIAEGFATGATIHEATGYPVAVAFNAGNLGVVAKAMRERFAELPLIVLC